jgi:AraC-like DNA-binding protein
MRLKELVLQAVRRGRRIAPESRNKLYAYRAGISQHSHRHDEPHVSLILAGSVLEECNGREFTAGPGMFALRPSGFRHQVRFGARGALIISAAVDPATLVHCACEDEGGWADAPAELFKLMLAEKRDGPAGAANDVLFDIIAHFSALASGPAPSWLAAARERLIEESVSIDALADEAGVHRVHFSRAFTRIFGCSPSVYRRRMAALRAVSSAVDGGDGADCAYACGFADQSHMARVLRQFTGASYNRLRTLRGEVTSVQE